MSPVRRGVRVALLAAWVALVLGLSVLTARLGDPDEAGAGSCSAPARSARVDGLCLDGR